MGQVLHPNAVTTHAIRKAIQEAPAKVSTNALAKRYGLNYRTVQKWRKRDSVEDRRSGLQDPRPKSLGKVEKAACLLFRCATKSPLDNCFLRFTETHTPSEKIKSPSAILELRDIYISKKKKTKRQFRIVCT